MWWKTNHHQHHHHHLPHVAALMRIDTFNWTKFSIFRQFLVNIVVVTTQRKTKKKHQTKYYVKCVPFSSFCLVSSIELDALAFKIKVTTFWLRPIFYHCVYNFCFFCDISLSLSENWYHKILLHGMLRFWFLEIVWCEMSHVFHWWISTFLLSMRTYWTDKTFYVSVATKLSEQKFLAAHKFVTWTHTKEQKRHTRKKNI